MSQVQKSEKGWTVYLIPDDPAREPVRFRVARRWVVLTGVSAALLLIWSALVTIYYYRLHRSYAYLVHVESEYHQVQRDFQKIQQYAYRLQTDLEHMRQQVQRLQMIAGIVAGSNIPQISGIGGESQMRARQLGRQQFLESQWMLAQQQKQAEALKQELDRLYRTFEQKSVALAATPSILPVRGYVVSGYGRRIDPFTGAPDFHAGVDIYAPYGAPVVAAASGRVIHAGRRLGYGKLVIIDHGFGIFTYYGHLSRILVRKGTHVKRWQIIGLVGSSGRSTGPHVHYEIRFQDQPLNPLNFVLHTF